MINKGIVFLLGVSSSLVIPSAEDALVLGLVSLTALIISLLFNHFRSEFFQSIKILLLGVTWACLNICIYSQQNKQMLPEPFKTNVEGIVCSIPESINKRIKFDFCINKINGENIGFITPNKFQFSWDEYSVQPHINLNAGQYWRLVAQLSPAHGRYNEAGFDYQKWMLAEGYAGTGKVKAKIQDEVYLLERASWLSIYHASRQKVFEKINFLLPDNQYKGLLLALTLGERAAISQTQWDVLRGSGTSHLLAISGLHIGVAALWCYWLVLYIWSLSQKLCLLMPAQKAAQISSLIGGLSILLLSGLGLPAQRAFFMLAIFILSRWLGYYYRLTSVLGLVLVLILIWQPFAVLSASFWLSFLAVFIIALVISRKQNESSKILGWLAINWYLYLAMLVISVLFFDMYSFVALVANLILIPTTSFLLIPILYSGMLLSFINETLAIWLFWLSSQIMEVIYWIQSHMTLLNVYFNQISINSVQLFIGTLIFIFLLLPKKLTSKWIYFPLSLIFLSSFSLNQQNKVFEMVVFDIGQGLSVYLETPHGKLIYDTGWGNHEYSIANSTLIPFLEARKIKYLDKMVISHADSDHSGGLTSILKEIKIGELLVGESLKINNLLLPREIQNCHSYPTWSWGEIKFEFLPHLSALKLKGNNASCVLSIDTPKGNVLLTGDIEKQAELALLNNGLKRFQVLVAPHHGSNTSSTDLFVKQVSPKIVIFSTGYNNQWAFPKEEVLARYAARTSQILITHKDGAISVELKQDNDSLTVTTFKQKRLHFWHE